MPPKTLLLPTIVNVPPGTVLVIVPPVPPIALLFVNVPMAWFLPFKSNVPPLTWSVCNVGIDAVGVTGRVLSAPPFKVTVPAFTAKVPKTYCGLVNVKLPNPVLVKPLVPVKELDTVTSPFAYNHKVEPLELIWPPLSPVLPALATMASEPTL